MNVLAVVKDRVLVNQFTKEATCEGEGKKKACAAEISMGDGQRTGPEPGRQPQPLTGGLKEVVIACESDAITARTDPESDTDPGTDVFLDPGWAGETLGTVNDLRKAGRPPVLTQPELTIAGNVLGDGHDGGLVKAGPVIRQRRANQASQLGKQAAGQIHAHDGDLALVDHTCPPMQTLAEPVAHGCRQGCPGRLAQ